jgi:hypothetical protein
VPTWIKLKFEVAACEDVSGLTTDLLWNDIPEETGHQEYCREMSFPGYFLAKLAYIRPAL